MFSKLNLHPTLLEAVAKMGYNEPTEVQNKVVPVAMGGADVMVSSQTGSGKTAAFLLPTLHQILTEESDSTSGDSQSRPRRGRGDRERMQVAKPKAIVMCPTRELALQVSKEAILLKGDSRNLRIATVVGGMPYRRQIKELQNVALVVATPGRLLDLYNQNAINFDDVRFFIADEADRMLDMGFSDDIKAIHTACRNVNQTLMFSATFPRKVMDLAESMMDHPVRVELAMKDNINPKIEQLLNWADGKEHQRKILRHWLDDEAIDQAVVFAPTQKESEEIADELRDEGVSASFLHGGLPQNVRNRRLDDLRRGRTKILIATDVAARGIDVASITHVINIGLPRKAEDYVHRIGRTGRAGRSGVAVTILHHKDGRLLSEVTRFIDQEIEANVIEGLEPHKTPSMGGNGGGKGRGRSRRNSSGGGRRSEGRNDERRESRGRRDFSESRGERGGRNERSNDRGNDRNERFSRDRNDRNNRNDRFEARGDRDNRRGSGEGRRERAAHNERGFEARRGGSSNNQGERSFGGGRGRSDRNERGQFSERRDNDNNRGERRTRRDSEGGGFKAKRSFDNAKPRRSRHAG